MKKAYFGIFLALMVLGGASIFLTGEKDFSENENRYLSKYTAIKSTDDVEGALADQFPLRDSWLTIASTARYVAGEREINDTYIGKDGYLFDKCSETDFNAKQYKNNLTCLNMLIDKYELTNVNLVLVPSPGIIMSDKLPANAPMYDANSKYALASMVFDGNANVVDLRNTLSTLSEETQTYYKTDHHWTTISALTAFQEIFPENNLALALSSEESLEQISDDFHGTLYSRVLLRNKVYDFIDRVNFDAQTKNALPDGLYDEAKLSTKDQYAYFLGGNSARVDFAGTGEGSLLVIKDSFANCMIPLLCTQFEQVTVIDLRYFSDELDIASYDQILVLYEMTNFAEDINLFKLTKM